MSSDRSRQRHRALDRAEVAADGAELFLTDRDAEGLERPSPTPARWARGVRAPALDISDYDAVDAFAADIHADHPAMDVVMNIAGVSAWGTVFSSPISIGSR